MLLFVTSSAYITAKIEKRFAFGQYIKFLTYFFVIKYEGRNKKKKKKNLQKRHKIKLTRKRLDFILVTGRFYLNPISWSHA